mgnify:CR=1 FL=1|tara:strand:- start:42832 stop:43335 length:504 start_codon:yes stop_codon:yes gene_type:complete
MACRQLPPLTELQARDIWSRWKKGETLTAIGREYDRFSTSIYDLLARHGGISYPVLRRSEMTLNLAEREGISRGIATGQSVRQIAANLQRSPSTISREIQRNGGRNDYRATQAGQSAWSRAKRPKPCKLATHTSLQQLVANKLKLYWSPQQIAPWLKEAQMKILMAC